VQVSQSLAKTRHIAHAHVVQIEAQIEVHFVIHFVVNFVVHFVVQIDVHFVVPCFLLGFGVSWVLPSSVAFWLQVRQVLRTTTLSTLLVLLLLVLAKLVESGTSATW
jgi:hypothetical protein